MFTFWLFLLTAGASARFTRLIVTDKAVRNFRRWLWSITGGKIELMHKEKDPENPDDEGFLVFDYWRWFMLNCPWCIGFWISLFFTWFSYEVFKHEGYVLLEPGWFVVPMMGASISYVIAFISGYEKNE